MKIQAEKLKIIKMILAEKDVAIIKKVKEALEKERKKQEQELFEKLQRDYNERQKELVRTEKKPFIEDHNYDYVLSGEAADRIEQLRSDNEAGKLEGLTIEEIEERYNLNLKNL